MSIEYIKIAFANLFGSNVSFLMITIGIAIHVSMHKTTN
jgi:Ca2+/Na+ antiporter